MPHRKSNGYRVLGRRRHYSTWWPHSGATGPLPYRHLPGPPCKEHMCTVCRSSMKKKRGSGRAATTDSMLNAQEGP
eukprot:3232174-Prorocentrum_lima.AAC.1